ncbi:MAG TPA: VOC family protein [Rhizomicrobium sp.]|nr:VOC family protein [Rhizomicrobium sp.]
MHGSFFWYDLMTTDTKAAAKFYGDVVGWRAEDSGNPGMNYSIFNLGSRGVAGLMPIADEMAKAGGRPAWLGYIHVDDVDAMAKHIPEEGGQLHKGPITVPGIIRFAVVSDPQGAAFLIATPLIKDAPPPIAPGTPGTIGWHELYAVDGKTAFPFYEKLFGWTKADAIDMGPMGTYQLFKTGGDMAAGGMMTKPPAIPMPYWGYYFNVTAVDAAAARVTAGGGNILNGPMEVPGPMWIVNCMDPQGAVFSLVAPKR